MRWIAVLLFWVLTSLPATGWAQPPREGGVMFSWVRGEAAEGCPDRATMAREITRRLGYDPFRPPFSQWLEGLVERTDAGLTATIYSRDAAGAMVGRRELADEGQGCAALGEAVALTLALAIDPEAALRTPAAEQGGPGAVADADANGGVATPNAAPVGEAEAEGTEAVAATGSAPSPPRSRTAHARVALGALGAYNLVPGLGTGVRLTVDGPIVRHLRWIGGAHYWTEQRAERGGAAFGIGLVSFSAGLCVGKAWDRLRLDGCATIDVGAFWAAVYAPDPLAPGERVHVGATALLRLEARVIGPLWVGMVGGLTIPFVRHGFSVQGRPEVVFRSSGAAPMAGLELAVHFL